MVMHVPIGDENPLDSVLLLGVARRDCDVVEDTETHPLIWTRMMSGRTLNRAEGVLCAFFSNTASTAVHQTAGGVQGDFPPAISD